ncbi:nicotinate (nicotinamide) nucleotide adenylyltransferase [Pseudomonadota bacterium]
MTNKRIGLFGGSFDPPHLGHEALVNAAIECLNLDEVWVVPAGSPVHRSLSGHADAQLRFKWVKEIFSDTASVRVLDWEIESSEPVPAITTLRRFRAENPNLTPLWLTGADAFEGMCGWVEYPEHLRLCSVAVFERSGLSQSIEHIDWRLVSIESWLGGEADGPGNIITVDVRLPDISATEVRNRALKDVSLEGLVNSRICMEVESRYRPERGDKN